MMFKKCIAVFMMSLFFVSSASAKPHGGHHQPPSPRGHPSVVVKHSHSNIGGILAAGVVGTVIGSLIASNSNQNINSYSSSSRCVVLRSRYDGHIVKRCYESPVCSRNCGEDVYDILYID